MHCTDVNKLSTEPVMLSRWNIAEVHETVGIAASFECSLVLICLSIYFVGTDVTHTLMNLLPTTSSSPCNQLSPQHYMLHDLSFWQWRCCKVIQLVL